MADYTTKAVIKGELGISDTADDTTIDQIIAAVTLWINRYCGRVFDIANPVQGQGTSTRTYTAASTGIVYIDDAIEIVLIETDDGTRTYATTMDADTYEGYPYNAPAAGGVYTQVNAFYGGAFPLTPRAVRVEARYGWAAVPAPVVRACILLTCKIFKRKDAPFGIMGSTSSELGQLLVIPRLDYDALAFLDAYKRHWWVA